MAAEAGRVQPWGPLTERLMHVTLYNAEASEGLKVWASWGCGRGTVGLWALGLTSGFMKMRREVSNQSWRSTRRGVHALRLRAEGVHHPVDVQEGLGGVVHDHRGRRLERSRSARGPPPACAPTAPSTPPWRGWRGTRRRARPGPPPATPSAPGSGPGCSPPSRPPRAPAAQSPRSRTRPAAPAPDPGTAQGGIPAVTHHPRSRLSRVRGQDPPSVLLPRAAPRDRAGPIRVKAGHVTCEGPSWWDTHPPIGDNEGRPWVHLEEAGRQRPLLHREQQPRHRMGLAV